MFVFKQLFYKFKSARAISWYKCSNKPLGGVNTSDHAVTDYR